MFYNYNKLFIILIIIFLMSGCDSNSNTIIKKNYKVNNNLSKKKYETIKSNSNIKEKIDNPIIKISPKSKNKLKENTVLKKKNLSLFDIFFSNKPILFSKKYVYVSGTSILQKVIAINDNTYATESNLSDIIAFKLQPLRPYFVLESNDSYYKITENDIKPYFFGYVQKNNIVEWNTREALHFREFNIWKDGMVIKAWNDRRSLENYIVKYDNESYKPDYYVHLKQGFRTKFVPFPLLDAGEIENSSHEKSKIYKVLIPVLLENRKNPLYPYKSIYKGQELGNIKQYISSNILSSKDYIDNFKNLKDSNKLSIILFRLQNSNNKYFNNINDPKQTNCKFTIKEAWIINKKDIFEEKIFIEKKTLKIMIELLEILSDKLRSEEELFIDIINLLKKTVVNIELSKEYDLQKLIEKRFGIFLQTNLLPFCIQDLTNDKRMRIILSKRLQIAKNNIKYFLEINKKLYSSQSHIWVPISKFELPLK